MRQLSQVVELCAFDLYVSAELPSLSVLLSSSHLEFNVSTKTRKGRNYEYVNFSNTWESTNSHRKIPLSSIFRNETRTEWTTNATPKNDKNNFGIGEKTKMQSRTLCAIPVLHWKLLWRHFLKSRWNFVSGLGLLSLSRCLGNIVPEYYSAHNRLYRHLSRFRDKESFFSVALFVLLIHLVTLILTRYIYLIGRPPSPREVHKPQSLLFSQYCHLLDSANGVWYFSCSRWRFLCLLPAPIGFCALERGFHGCRGTRRNMCWCICYL